MDRLTEIKRIQTQIVGRIERGEDIGELSRELAAVRAEIVAAAEIAELEKIAAERLRLRDKAEAVLRKVGRQGKAVDAFLAARDDLVQALQPVLESAGELARLGEPSWEREPGECYLFADAAQFHGAMSGIPQELFPEDFSCPALVLGGEMKGERSLGQAEQVLLYMQAASNVLKAFDKGSMHVRAESIDRLLLEREPETTGVSCVVCAHEQAAAINDAIREGASLRELEARYAVSRSTLSRHKNRCLNLGAVKVTDAIQG